MTDTQQTVHPVDYDGTEREGCIIGEPNDCYHASDAISNTKLWEFHKRPALFFGKYVSKEVERKESAALLIGSALHTIVLEGQDAFDHEYCPSPEGLEWRSKAGKLEAAHALNDMLFEPRTVYEVEQVATGKREEIEAFFAQYPGRKILYPDQFEIVQKCHEALLAHPIASKLLASGLPEVVFRSPMTTHGYRVQCRADWLNINGCEYTDGEPYGVDLKSIDDLSKWNNNFRKLGYYRAWPFYTKTMELTIGHADVVKRWFWIVVEKAYPFEVRVVTPSPECWQRGMDELGYDMPALANAIHHNDFADEGKDKVLLQQLPDWMLDAPVKAGIPAVETID